jgi:hypothetical protein
LSPGLDVFVPLVATLVFSVFISSFLPASFFTDDASNPDDAYVLIVVVVVVLVVTVVVDRLPVVPRAPIVRVPTPPLATRIVVTIVKPKEGGYTTTSSPSSSRSRPPHPSHRASSSIVVALPTRAVLRDRICVHG